MDQKSSGIYSRDNLGGSDYTSINLCSKWHIRTTNSGKYSISHFAIDTSICVISTVLEVKMIIVNKGENDM